MVDTSASMGSATGAKDLPYLSTETEGLKCLSCVFICPVQDGKTPMETLYSWQNGAKSLLCNFSQKPDTFQ